MEVDQKPFFVKVYYDACFKSDKVKTTPQGQTPQQGLEIVFGNLNK